jgi:hypothetical protein
MGICQGLCSYNGHLFAAWKGEVGDDRLFYSQFDGSVWSPQVQIPGVASSIGPALSVSPDGLYLYAAWRGAGSDERLWYASFDGSDWSAQALIPGAASSVGPALSWHWSPLAGFKVTAAWKGSGSDESLWYASFDGSNWSAQALIPGAASNIGPAMSSTFPPGGLYPLIGPIAAWKGSGSDERLWYASYDVDGNNWSAQAQIPGVASSIGPALCGDFGRVIYAAWRGAGSDERLWYAFYDVYDNTWSAQSQIPGAASSIGPSLASSQDGYIYAMWKGSDSDQRIWYASFDGTNWSTPATLPGDTGQETLRSFPSVDRL